MDEYATRESATEVHEAAIRYAKRGWRVLPLHSTMESGACSCGKLGCPSVGKHPRTANGLFDATTELVAISRWFGRWPDANVGVLAGAESGLLVLDVDLRHGGDESLAELEREHGPLPDTVQAHTGGGGRH